MIFRRQAMSLIEILVVVAIIAVLMGLIGFSTSRTQTSSQVRAAAEELASVLRRTRHRAVTEQRMYAVAFNIQNEPGSSGAVLNNRSGGHWYRVIGPSLMTRASAQSPEGIPWAQGKRYEVSSGEYRNANFPDFLRDVSSCWAGPAHVLPAWKVRFLALGDTDEGPRRRWESGRKNDWYAAGGETTYPRPWFGYFDATTGRLWPWGAYDPSKASSGFYYQGKDPVIAGCRNSADRTVNHDWNSDSKWMNQDLNGDGDFDDFGEKEIAFPLVTQGQPRPLVNADWLDAIILFHADGSAEFAEWNRARRAYSAKPDPTPDAGDNNNLSGIPDRAKPGPPNGDFTPLSNYSRGICPYEIGEVAHFTAHTGGWHITLAPDSLDDRTTFPNAQAAMASISPCWRVFVSASGTVTTFQVMERSGYAKALLSQNKAWPNDPSQWLDTGTYNSNQVWLNCRLGWLCNPPVPSWNAEAPLVPRGQPITNILDPDMLTQRIWWRLP